MGKQTTFGDKEAVEVEDFLFEHSFPILQKIDEESDMLGEVRIQEETCYYA